QWFRDLVKLHDRGFILTGRVVSPGRMAAAPSTPAVRDEPAGRVRGRRRTIRLRQTRVAGRSARGSRSDPGFGSTRVCRWPVAWLVMKSGACNDLGGENHGDEPVHGGAERRPPPCVGHVVAV